MVHVGKNSFRQLLLEVWSVQYSSHLPTATTFPFFSPHPAPTPQFVHLFSIYFHISFHLIKENNPTNSCRALLKSNHLKPRRASLLNGASRKEERGDRILRSLGLLLRLRLLLRLLLRELIFKFLSSLSIQTDLQMPTLTTNQHLMLPCQKPSPSIHWLSITKFQCYI